MTLYEMISFASEILTPRSNSFYSFVLNTCDDRGGVLVSRDTKLGMELENKEVPYADKFVVCFDQKFDYTKYYKEDGTSVGIKMHFFYASKNVQSDIEWCSQIEFRHAYVFHIPDKTYKYINRQKKVVYKVDSLL